MRARSLNYGFNPVSTPPPSATAAFSSVPHTEQEALVLLLAIAGGLTSIFVLALSALIIYYRFNQTSSLPGTSTAAAAASRLSKFTFKQLKKATGSFDESNRLGQGGFGTVYKGILSNGKLVAVKSMDSFSLQSEREFENEISLIGGVDIKCEHIVGLIGYCAEKKHRLLVYEYMAHRSLQEALFDEEYPLSLDWKMRFNVIVDIAQALKFLHYGSSDGCIIIHGDVKPSNVLLDEKFRARIADFGLARLKNQNVADADDPEMMMTMRSEEINIDGEVANRTGRGDRNKETGNLRNKGADDDENMKKADACTTKGDDEFSFQCQDAAAYDDDEEDEEDWWWKQGDDDDCGQSGIVKDYTVDWIACEVKSRHNKKDDNDDDDDIEKQKKGQNNKKWKWRRWLEREKVANKKMSEEIVTKSREWWKEEYVEELSNKSREMMMMKGEQCKMKKMSKKNKKKKKRDLTYHNSSSSIAWSGDLLNWIHRHRGDSSDLSSDLQNHDQYHRNRQRSQNWNENQKMKSMSMSMRSSTPSMRGTICYVAPEYGGGGVMCEKSDVYSFGVLMLVIISGRRPLQVVWDEKHLERANLITWARHLAYNGGGDVIELVDGCFGGKFSKEEARMCIMIALKCLHRLPSVRPSMVEVVQLLSGSEMSATPSPPAQLQASSSASSSEFPLLPCNEEGPSHHVL